MGKGEWVSRSSVWRAVAVGLALAVSGACGGGGGGNSKSNGQASSPRVVTANVKQVEADFPASAYVAELTSPPPGARVVDIQVHDFHYFPSEFSAAPGEQIAVHLVDTDFTGYSIMFNLPSGLTGMKTGVGAGKDAYIAFSAPSAPGAYSFFDPRGPVRFFGTFGYMNVTSEGASAEGE